MAMVHHNWLQALSGDACDGRSEPLVRHRALRPRAACPLHSQGPCIVIFTFEFSTPLQLDSKGILQVRPDFNSERLPYRIETAQHDIFEYVMEHCSRPMDEEVRKKEAQIKNGANRCVLCLSALLLVCRDLQPAGPADWQPCRVLLCCTAARPQLPRLPARYAPHAPITVVDCHASCSIIMLPRAGEIVSCTGFEYDHLYVRVLTELTDGWSALERSISFLMQTRSKSSLQLAARRGVTDLCLSQQRRYDCCVRHCPLSMLRRVPLCLSVRVPPALGGSGPGHHAASVYLCRGLHGLVALNVLSAIGIVAGRLGTPSHRGVCPGASHAHSARQGYCGIPLPLEAGSHDVELATWRPQGNSRTDELKRYFIGGGPFLSDMSYVLRPSDFSGKVRQSHVTVMGHSMHVV